MPIPASSVLPLLADLKAEVNISTDTHDDELQNKLDAAVEVAEMYVGKLDEQSFSETHYGAGGGPILLRHRPVLSVTSVEDADSTTYTTDDYLLDGEAGLLRPPSGGSRTFTTTSYRGGAAAWSGTDVTVTYTAGRESLPARYREAILMIGAHLWGPQRGNVPSALPVDDDLVVPPGFTFSVPARAVELLLGPQRGQAA